MRADGRGRRWWWPVVPAVSAGGLGAAVIDPGLLARGGLAIPAIAIVFAFFIGAPLARAHWVDEADTAGAIGSRSLVQMTIWISLGVALAGVLPPSSQGFAGVVGVWALAAVAALFEVGSALGVLVWLAVGGLAVWHGLRSSPWSLLEPSFEGVWAWLPVSLMIGTLAGLAPGAWHSAASAHPGRSSLPSVAAGSCLMAVLAASVVVAGDWEASLGQARAGASIVLFTLLVGGSVVVVLRREVGTTRGLAVAVGCAASVWFLTLGEADRWFWWSASAPALLGAAFALDAWRTRSLTSGIAAALLIGAAIVGFPGVPSLVPPAVAAVLPPIAVTWYAATHALSASTR